MFTWPTPELTDYERKFVRLYREPMLDAQGNAILNSSGLPAFWPGVLRRMYKVNLNNVTIPGVPGMDDGPHFTDVKYLATRRTRVFGLTFFGDCPSIYLMIKSLSGETYTVNPCLVSSMQAGTPWDADSALGELAFDVSIPGAVNRNYAGFGIQLEPNIVLDQNDGLLFTGLVAPGANLDVENGGWPYRVLSIGIHVWEFPNMGSSNEQIAGRV